jgi:hypothetical protein
MIAPVYILTMAAYNPERTAVWMALPRGFRRPSAGSSAGSIHYTLSHILWGQQWMSRFAEKRKPGPFKGR